MKTFRTEIKLKKGQFPEINYGSNVFLIGSCFSDNIGDKFNHFGFSCISNPFGVTYNPVSIGKQIDRIIEKRSFSESDLIEKGESFNSFELHGSYDDISKEALLGGVNQKILESHDFIKNASHMFITLGTAWVYELVERNEIVNNCHKLPAENFTKRLLSSEEVTESLSKCISACRTLNPDLKFIFTVSPVRHLKDGFRENNLSKGILHVSISELLKTEKVHYFPSYEILLDDLRDYRFFENDLLHPNSQAIEYIWDKLVSSTLDQASIDVMEEVKKIKLALSHRPFNPMSSEHRSFLLKTKKDLDSLSENHPEINLKEEMRILEDRLSE